MTNEMVARELNQGLGWLVALGILMILLGIVAIVEPLIATIVVARVLSWTLLFAGIVRMVHAIQSRRQRVFWLKLLVGILYALAGILLLSNVFRATLTLTIVFGVVILAQGILEAIAAFKVRPEPNWGWLLFSGIIAIILGILILYRWPFNAIWLIGLFAGISFISSGVWMIAVPLAIRNHLSRTTSPQNPQTHPPD
jgi:uncharacterized membrane protein HdeD (DUF308 family)